MKYVKYPKFLGFLPTRTPRTPPRLVKTNHINLNSNEWVANDRKIHDWAKGKVKWSFDRKLKLVECRITSHISNKWDSF